MSQQILSGKIALITGGSGGIGRVVARHLAGEGATVCVLGHDRKKLDSVLIDLKQTCRGRVTGLCCDVGSWRSVENSIGRAASKLGGLDILINAAGIQAPIGRFVDNDLAAWELNLKVNLMGTVYGCKAAIPWLVKRQGGVIVNFSGGGSTNARVNFSAYATAKCGIVRFTEILAEELRQENIRVHAVAPGAVNTGMLEEVLAAGAMAGEKELSEAQSRAIKGGVSADLAAELILFLVSARSYSLSGKLISAVWDPWRTWDQAAIEEIMSGDKCSLRRV